LILHYGKGVISIDAEIEHDLFNLDVIAPNHRFFVGKFRFERYHFVECILTDMQHVFHDKIEIDGGNRDLSPARQRQELLDHVRCTVAGFVDGAHYFEERFRRDGNA
jgi:hypothetical protein